MNIYEFLSTPARNSTVMCLINFLKYLDYDSDDDTPIPTGTLRDVIRKQKKKMQSTSSLDD